MHPVNSLAPDSTPRPNPGGPGRRTDGAPKGTERAAAARRGPWWVAAAWLAGGGAVAAAEWGTRSSPAWLAMSAIAGTEFVALKLATLRGHWASATLARI